MDLRAYVYGIITGIVMLVGSFVVVCEIGGIKWQPVVTARHS
jgi:hypothetical protein